MAIRLPLFLSAARGQTWTRTAHGNGRPVVRLADTMATRRELVAAAVGVCDAPVVFYDKLLHAVFCPVVGPWRRRRVAAVRRPVPCVGAHAADQPDLAGPPDRVAGHDHVRRGGGGAGQGDLSC